MSRVERIEAMRSEVRAMQRAGVSIGEHVLLSRVVEAMDMVLAHYRDGVDREQRIIRQFAQGKESE